MEKDGKTTYPYDEEEPISSRTSNIPGEHISKVWLNKDIT